MDTATRVQILDKTDYISHSTNTLGKGMNPIILPMCKIVEQTRFFSLGEITSLRKGKLCLKIDFVSYPAWAEGLVNMNMLDFNIIVSKFKFQ